jgi:hypothetical protein
MKSSLKNWPNYKYLTVFLSALDKNIKNNFSHFTNKKTQELICVISKAEILKERVLVRSLLLQQKIVILQNRFYTCSKFPYFEFNLNTNLIIISLISSYAF